MAEYLAPGVYMEEVESGAVPIEGASTSTAGFLGETERGPVVPQFLTSFEDFRRHFGSFAHYKRDKPLYGTSLAYAVQGFFENGGQRCYVGRVTDEEEIAGRAFAGYEAEPVLAASVETLEFGEHVVGETAEVTVRLFNPGIENDPAVAVDSPELTLQDGDPSEVTLVGDFEDGFEIRADDSVEVTVEYTPHDAHSLGGTLEFSHDGVDSPLEIDLTGGGREAYDPPEDLEVSPAPVDFGFTNVDVTEELDVTITHAGPPGSAPLTITDVSADTTGSGDQYEVVDSPADPDDLVLERGQEATATVEYEPGSATDHTGELEITVEDPDGNDDPQTVGIEGEALSSSETLGATVTEVEFGDVSIRAEAERRISVVNRAEDGDPITADLQDLPDPFEAEFPGGQAEVTLAPREEAVVLVSFSPDAAQGESEDLELEYDGGAETLTIPVSGTGTDEDGELVIDGIDFGQAVVGDRRVRNLQLRNDGPAGASDVTVDTVEVDAGTGDHEAFEVLDDDPSTDLPVGESTEVAILFEPEFTGGSSGEVTVSADESGGTSTSEFTASLDGVGADPATAFEAVGPGEWGGRVAVEVRNSSRDNENFRLTIRYWSELEPGGPSSRDRLEAQAEADFVETFDGLSTDEASSNYYVSTLDDSSFLVDVDEDAITGERPDNGVRFLHYEDEDGNGGDDEGVGRGDFLGDASRPRGERDGLEGFKERDDISIVCIPDENSVPNLVGVAADHCEEMEDRFAIMQADAGADPGDLPYQDSISDYGAFYYPHIEVVDPVTNERKEVPPGGHVAGVYARTDADRGVHKAPANETVRGAVGLEVPITRADQERLNPKGVNAIRSFEGRGIRIWGARTTSPNPLWTYVNVRRLLLYIEESIEDGTQWAVFEPNNEELWARLRQSVRNFLTTVWRTGALMGSTPEEAFYVKCDRSTMTQDDIDKGRLIVEIGVAPTKPAEFVVFRISQWTGGVEGGE